MVVQVKKRRRAVPELGRTVAQTSKRRRQSRQRTLLDARRNRVEDAVEQARRRAVIRGRLCSRRLERGR